MKRLPHVAPLLMNCLSPPSLVWQKGRSFARCRLNKWRAIGRNELPFGRLYLGRPIHPVSCQNSSISECRATANGVSVNLLKSATCFVVGRTSFTVVGMESSTRSCCWEKVVQAFLMNDVHRRSDDLDCVGATDSFHFSSFSIHPRTTACSSAVRLDCTESREAVA